MEDTARLDQGTQSSAVREPGVRPCGHRLKRSSKRILRASCVGGVVWTFCETTGSRGRILRIKWHHLTCDLPRSLWQPVRRKTG